MIFEQLLLCETDDKSGLLMRIDWDMSSLFVSNKKVSEVSRFRLLPFELNMSWLDSFCWYRIWSLLLDPTAETISWVIHGEVSNSIWWCCWPYDELTSILSSDWLFRGDEFSNKSNSSSIPKIWFEIIRDKYLTSRTKPFRKFTLYFTLNQDPFEVGS